MDFEVRQVCCRFFPHISNLQNVQVDSQKVIFLLLINFARFLATAKRLQARLSVTVPVVPLAIINLELNIETRIIFHLWSHFYTYSLGQA